MPERNKRVALQEAELPGVVPDSKDFSHNTLDMLFIQTGRRRISTTAIPIQEVPNIPMGNIDTMQAIEEYEAADITTETPIKHFTKLEDFIEKLPTEQKDTTHKELLETYGIPLEMTGAIQINSSTSGNIVTAKAGTNLIRGRKSSAKSLPLKKKITNHRISSKSENYNPEYNLRPLLQGFMPLSKELGKINPETRKIIDTTDITEEKIKELQEQKDPNIKPLHLSFTPLEILRSIENGDIEIERIERDDQQKQFSKIILKYKQGYGPLEFEEQQGRIIINLQKSKGERQQQYQKLLLLDLEKTRDEKIANKISDIVDIGERLKDQEDKQAFVQFLTDNLHQDYLAYEQRNHQQEIPLRVLARQDGTELIPFGGDLDLQSFTISTKLYKAVGDEKEYLEYLYKPIKITPSSLSSEDNLIQRKDLLDKTTKLLQKLAPYYFENITTILTNLAAEIKDIKSAIRNVKKNKTQLEQLQQKLLFLEQKKSSIENSEFYKELNKRYNTQKTEKWWQRIFKFNRNKQIISENLPTNSIPEPIELDILFNNDPNKKKYFTNFVGNTTPIQFLDKTIMNYLGQSELLQHAADHWGEGETFILDTGTHIHVFGDKIFSTTTEQERVELWLTEDIFDDHYMHVNPTVDMEIWAPLIEKQLTSKYKDMVDKTTEEQYFQYLFKNNYNNLKLLLQEKIDNNLFLNTQQKKDLLEQIMLKIHSNQLDLPIQIVDNINMKIAFLNMQIQQEISASQQNDIRRGLATKMMNLVPRFKQRAPANMLDLAGRTSPYGSPRNSSSHSPRAPTYYETPPKEETQPQHRIRTNNWSR